MKLSCVLLTMGNRPAELRRAIASVFEQEGVDIEVVVVGNGADLPDLDERVVTVRLPENVGIRSRPLARCAVLPDLRP